MSNLVQDQGAYFRDVSGWESADWYGGDDIEVETGELTWGRPHWFSRWAEEHCAVREGVGLIDMSFMSKFEVKGRRAGELLNYLSTGNVDDKRGEVRYVQWLNEDGKMEADLTINKVDENEFFIVATDSAHRHVQAWIKKQAKKLDVIDDIYVTDVSGALAQINIQGPRSREVMSALTREDMSDEAFPFRRAAEIEIGYARVKCMRMTYVGELGYELFVPTEQAVHVYERILKAGQGKRLHHVGLKALASLRMEKAYRDYGHDLDNTDHILSTGLAFTCDYDKKGGFIGKEAVVRMKEQLKGKAPSRRVVQVLVKDPEPLMYHGEILLRDGVVVGDIRAASYGHTLGGAVGLGFVEGEVCFLEN